MAKRKAATTAAGKLASKAQQTAKATSAKTRGKAVTEKTRDILFRPHRHSYVRGKNRPAHCVFCAALEKGIGFESLLVFKSPHAIVLLNKYPYNNGHLLVLPARHVSDLALLKSDEYQQVMEVLRASVAILQKAFEPHGVNMGLNMGAAAGAGLPDHLHFHLIPRWSGDTNFFPLIAETKVISQTLDQTFDAVAPFFKKLSV